MKRYSISIIMLAIFIFSFETIMAQNKRDLSSLEQKLWQLEEKYMISYKDKNLNLLTEFWDGNFIGWPEWSELPIAVGKAKKVLSKRAKNKITTFKIKPQNILIKRNVAVVFYLVDLNLIDEKKEETKATYRIIHTWIKDNEKWRILGGMSAK